MSSKDETPSIPAEKASTPHIYTGLNEVLGDLSSKGIGKARRNEQQKYNFRGIDDLYNVMSPMLAERKVLILPRVVANRVELRETKDGKQMYHVYVEVEYDLISVLDGSKYTARYPGEALDTSDKATNKAMTAAFKYLCFQLFCIPIEGQEDADAHSPEAQAPKAKARPEPEQSPQEFIDLLDIAPTMEALKSVFKSAWQGYPEQDFRSRFQRSYDARKTALLEQGGQP